MSAAAREVKTKLVDATTVATKKAVRYPLTGGRILQGKIRHPSSRAADEYRARETARLKKALQTVTHGKHIFAYNNIRTNQVVYSLSRQLDQNSVLSQLIYHGKKTVPAKLRKDMWTPYFSIHFPSPDQGLETYRLLREFSMLRQFSPPEDAIKITKEWLDKKRPRDLIEAEQFDEEYEWRIGKFLDKKTRARILMDQKESSVADVAEALRIVKEEEDAKKQPQNKEAKEKKKLSRKAKAKLKMQKQREKIHDKETRRRLADLEAQLSKEMTTHAERAHRKLAKKVLDDAQAQQQPPKYEVKISEADEETAHANPPADEIRMFWVDVEDANYAKDWPSYVYHGKLSPNREHIIEHRLDLQHVARNRAEAEEAERAERTRAARAALDEPGSPFLEQPKKKGLLSKLKFW